MNGLLVEPDSPEAAADALGYLMAHKRLAATMGAANRLRGSAMGWKAACDLTLAALGYEAG